MERGTKQNEKQKQPAKNGNSDHCHKQDGCKEQH